jgi:hypothetical protein
MIPLLLYDKVCLSAFDSPLSRGFQEKMVFLKKLASSLAFEFGFDNYQVAQPIRSLRKRVA